MTSSFPVFDRFVPLAPHTTIGLGGPASHFVTVTSFEQMRSCLAKAKEHSWPVHILGGGSNVIFSDNGFEGLVIRIGLSGIETVVAGNHVTLRAAAGESWDRVVRTSIELGAGGIECLSGIPGSVGAVPIQNVGAYGQEVSETIQSVSAIDRATHDTVEFDNAECGFDYRQSRFKQDDRDRYIVTGVVFRLVANGVPQIKYKELEEFVRKTSPAIFNMIGAPALQAVRESVLSLRKRKSMVVDAADPHSRSCGSFFMNPVLDKPAFDKLQALCQPMGSIPSFPVPEGVKVPAAWLVEKSGFHKGYRLGGVGVSVNHSLALVNYGGTTKELLALARSIQKKVQETFGVTLEREPVVVS